MQLRLAALGAATTLLLLSACATQSQKMSAEAKRQHAQTLKVRRERAVKAQDLKERNMVIEMRKKLNGAQRPQEITGDEAVMSEAPTELPSSFLEAQSRAQDSFIPKTAEHSNLIATKIPATLPNRLLGKLAVNVKPALAALPPTPIAVQQEQTGEHYLYSKILETYAAKNGAELERTISLLMKSYPDSIFADNAIYLDGKLAFEAGDQKKALQVFDRVLREYPRSNKAVAALFAKASIQKRLGHAAEAKREFIQVRDLYPGSPEATRVSVELQLLESNMKRRES